MLSFYNICYRATGRKIKLKVTERKIRYPKVKIGNQSFVLAWVFCGSHKKITEIPESRESRVGEKGNNPRWAILKTKVLLQSEIRFEMFLNFIVKDQFENFKGHR